MSRLTTRVVVLTLLTIQLIAGCAKTRPALTPYSVLFDENGRERADPIGDLYNMLKASDLSDTERRALVDEVVTVLEKGNAYSQLVAGRCLVYITRLDWHPPGVGKVGGPSLVTQRMVDVVARKCLEVSHLQSYDEFRMTWILKSAARRDRYEWDVPPEIVAPDDIRIPHPRYDYPVDAALIVEVGSEVLPELLPLGGKDEPLLSSFYTGWRIGRAQVWLDDRLVADEPRPSAGDDELRCNESIFIPLEKELPGEALLGEHTYRVRVELVAPNDMFATVEWECHFKVLDDREEDPYLL